MVPTMLKRLVLGTMLTAWMLAASGCGVKQSDYDAKVAEAKSHADKVSQLQKDVDAVKNDLQKSRETRKREAEAKTKALEQENANLRNQVKTIEQELAGLKTNSDQRVSQLTKDLTVLQKAFAKSEEARKAAEARIKSLEQENAELKKKPAKPLDFLKRK
jgi:chromosome segregation ATPase